MRACKQIAITVFVTCKKIAFIAFGILKKMTITALGPLLDYGLYYYDLYSDSYFTYTLANNCHWKYFSFSIGILLSSYFITVAYLRYHVQVIFEFLFIKPTLVLYKPWINATEQKGEEPKWKVLLIVSSFRDNLVYRVFLCSGNLEEVFHVPIPSWEKSF